MFNCEARNAAKEFNRREMQLIRSPEFWAIHIKPLRKESAGRPKLDVSPNETRVIRVNGRRDVQSIVQGVSSEREALHKLQDAVLTLLFQ